MGVAPPPDQAEEPSLETACSSIPQSLSPPVCAGGRFQLPCFTAKTVHTQQLVQHTYVLFENSLARPSMGSKNSPPGRTCMCGCVCACASVGSTFQYLTPPSTPQPTSLTACPASCASVCACVRVCVRACTAELAAADMVVDATGVVLEIRVHCRHTTAHLHTLA